MKVVYIHGANGSPISFKYIQSTLPKHDKLDITYSVSVPLLENIEKIEKDIKDNFGNNKFSIIGHSLGGVIAVGLHHKFSRLDRTVTISAPFGGSRFIEYIRWICPGYRLFDDVRTSSPVIKAVLNTSIVKPFKSIVTSGGGNPLFGEPNDGTVTVSSQVALDGPDYLHCDLHHFEVLLSDSIVNEIETFLFPNRSTKAA